ncbi:MAG: FMN-binding glutamate synthase family protein [Planctomycetes bacterium]|nr:FMN-binding glutamate synthase family protein [Planctomycetota bacterium]
MIPWWGWVLIGIGAWLLFTLIVDVTQRKHSIIRNFPLLGRFRFFLEKFGAPLRQYLFQSDLDERPFNRMQRSWVYRVAKGQNSTIGFGTQLDQDKPGLIKFHPSPFPTLDLHRKDEMEPVIIGHNRKRPFSVKYCANISGMSYGALSKNAVLALSHGAKLAGGYMSTGEGSLSPYHLEGGADICYQLGPAYFGCRTPEGRFDRVKFVELMKHEQVKMIEIKLSQGAKPGKGGVLPKEKITREIADIRRIPMGEDCHSPNCHPEFNDLPTLMKFVNEVRDLADGRPVGIKLCLGGEEFIRDVARYLQDNDDGPDFIQIDGGEGGTGAAPMSFADHIGISLQEALVITDNILREHTVRDKIVVIGSGRLVTGAECAIALGLGADLCMVARGYMFALGCIQALQCNTNHCPTGVATQSKWLMRGLDPTDKSVRVANYMRALNHDVMSIAWALGVEQPAQIERQHMSMIVEPGRRVQLTEIYPATMKAFRETRIMRKPQANAA